MNIAEVNRKRVRFTRSVGRGEVDSGPVMVVNSPQGPFSPPPPVAPFRYTNTATKRLKIQFPQHDDGVAVMMVGQVQQVLTGQVL